MNKIMKFGGCFCLSIVFLLFVPLSVSSQNKETEITKRISYKDCVFVEKQDGNDSYSVRVLAENEQEESPIYPCSNDIPFYAANHYLGKLDEAGEIDSLRVGIFRSLSLESRKKLWSRVRVFLFRIGLSPAGRLDYFYFSLSGDIAKDNKKEGGVFSEILTYEDIYNANNFIRSFRFSPAVERKECMHPQMIIFLYALKPSEAKLRSLLLNSILLEDKSFKPEVRDSTVVSKE